MSGQGIEEYNSLSSGVPVNINLKVKIVLSSLVSCSVQLIGLLYQFCWFLCTAVTRTENHCLLFLSSFS